MIRQFLLIIVFSTLLFNVKAEGYRIKVEVEGLQNQQLMLGYHWGSKSYLIDTVDLDGNARAIFQRNELLPQGMYFLLFPDKNYCELLITDDQEFEIKTVFSSFISSMEIKGSLENEIFYKYQSYSLKMRMYEAQNKENLAYFRHLQDSVVEINKRLSQIRANLEVRRTEIIAQYPELFLSSILKAMQNPEIPEIPPHNYSAPDSVFRYNYYKDHYFDNFNLKDERFLRTSLYEKKLEIFFKNIILNDLDSLKSEADKMAFRVKENQQVYSYTLLWMLKFFEMSWGPNMDEIFVYLSDNYFLNNGEVWNSEIIKKVSARADNLRPTLIGRTAPDFKMESPDGEYFSMHQIDAEFKLLVFWNTDCEHCMEILPQLVKLMENYNRQEIKITAVYIGSDEEKWRNYTDEYLYEWINLHDPDNLNKTRDLYDIYRTPEIYLVDRENKILARRLNFEDIAKSLDIAGVSKK